MQNPLKYLLPAFAGILFICYVFISCFSSHAKSSAAVKIVESTNYDGKVFVNPVTTTISKERTVWYSMWRWISSKNIRGPGKTYNFKTDPSLLKSRSPDDLRVIWIGHSTLLIMIDGKTFLTDPIWSRCASPMNTVGPARFFDPPIMLDNLPEIEGVIISHNHYDHLDSATVKTLSKKGIHFYVSLGIGDYLRSWDVSEKQIHEFDWWESIPVGKEHAIAATPARHFSNRGLFDRNKTLWSSWVITGPKHRIFYGADGGLFPGFDTISKRYGPFDITFLEVGAYDENWPDIHLGPDNAFLACSQLKGKLLFPIHWGTFNLAIHSWTEPAERLISLSKKNDIQIVIPEPGRIVDCKEKPSISYWWK